METTSSPNTTALLPSSSSRNRKKIPSSRDWDSEKSEIEKLYCNERKTLKDLICFMAGKGYKVSPKTCKDRITKWGFEKNLNKNDMMFVLYQRAQRLANGKDTRFVVRGRVMDHDTVNEFIRRRKMPRQFESSLARPRTPSHITYGTPSPSISPATLGSSSSLPTMTATGNGTMVTTGGSIIREVQNEEHLVVQDGPDDLNDYYTVSCVPGNMWRAAVVQNTQLLVSPSLPQLYFVPEELFRNIKGYSSGSIKGGVWNIDDGSYCLNNDGKDERAQTINNFHSLCTLSIKLFKDGQFVEARKTLSHGCRLLTEILRNKYPDTLSNILSVVLLLQSYNFSNIVAIVVNHIAGLASNIDSEDITQKHWKNICQYLANVEPEQISDVFLKLWECHNDVLEYNLGRLHPITLDSYSIYISQRGDAEGPAVVEPVIRTLLFELEQDPEGKSEQIFELMDTLAFNLHGQGRYVDSLAVGFDIRERAKSWGNEPRELRSLETIGHAYHKLDVRDQAEARIREMATMAIKVYGPSHSETLRSWHTLKTWYNGWGREEEANLLDQVLAKMITEPVD